MKTLTEEEKEKIRQEIWQAHPNLAKGMALLNAKIQKITDKVQQFRTEDPERYAEAVRRRRAAEVKYAK